MKGISTKLGLLLGALTIGFAASAHDMNGVQKMRSTIPHFLKPKAAAKPAGDIQYYGGSVISNVKIVSVFWTDKVDSTVQSQIGDFYSAVVTSPYVDWLTEYNTTVQTANGTAGTNQTIGRGSYAGSVTINPSMTSGTITDVQIQSELNAQLSKGGIPTPDANTLYVLHFPAGMQITLDSGGQTAASCQDFCAYHGAATTSSGQNMAYAVMPDMGGNCSFGCGSSNNSFDVFTNVVSHEIIEAITDPYISLLTGDQPQAPLAWYDLNNGEIADICQETAGNITGSNGKSYVVQGGWSQARNSCVTK